MEIGKCLTQIKEWEFNDKVIIGNIQMMTGIKSIGMTPPLPDDQDWYIFNVCPYREIINITQNKTLFKGQTYSAYKLKIGKEKPTVDVLFSLIVDAMGEFAKIYNEKTKNTIIHQHKVAIPKIEDHKQALKDAIDKWDIGIRNISHN